ncbi:Heterocyst differentiation ATP-binding protein HepA [Acaryochloris thomasi RCC1774]|uniref:Heterocyst differentiation ATP-binding protein HepA n=1 Tax=Acaryochloris thomasi RCC1774 TaxID=1764569 RepID=A0A2W1K501_9CYAN|nr:heterocyst formation ABC transporter subunit HepA [Acaryochloris thomasi]PZD75021.1 Heterocyst differentiation ATP-binding protein HepA [Acaryochloris thomasi RCC1774]
MPKRSLKLPTFVRNFLKATSIWQEHRLILRELKYFRRLLFLAITSSLISAITAAISIGLIGALLQGLTTPQAPPLQTDIAWIDNGILGVQASVNERIYRLGGLSLIAAWVQMATTYWGQLASRYAAFGLVNRVRKALFEQIQGLKLSFFMTTSTGALVTTLTGEVNQIQQVLNSISQMITQMFLLSGYAVSMALLSWQLSLATIVIFGLLSVGMTALRRRVREASFAVPIANKKFSSVTLEFINGIRTVHASGTQNFERERYGTAADQVYRAARRLSKGTLSVQPLTQGFASSLLIILIILAYTILVSNGILQATTLLAFLFALFRTLPIVAQMSGSRVNVSSLQGSLKSVTELLERKNKPYLRDGDLAYQSLQSAIELVDVSFGYDPEQLVLQNVSMAIKQGQTTALVGSSGAGKTTLADLIPRFFDPTAGQILVDGVDLRQLQINSLRSRMAIVSQDTFIFNASVYYNIAYGLADVTDAEVRQAAEQANALEFILEMPEQFETQLGDRGLRLSGGQRQRIAIARALLRNPEILILDEATSALDSVTEQLIQESLTTLSSGRTVISIAHRLSTISNADQVIVLEQGQIVEQGTYQGLLEQQGKLWQYHQMQYQQSAVQA